MPAEIRVPVIAESVFEATVGRWLKQPGEAVSAGDTVLELETDKINVEVTAPVSGVMGKPVRQQGDTVKPGDLLVTIAEGTAAATQPHQPGSQRDAAPAPAVVVGPAAVDATPVARNLAEARGISIQSVHGTGPGGRVTREDVETRSGSAKSAAVAPSSDVQPLPSAPTPAARTQSPSTARKEDRVKLTRRQLTMAKRLAEVSHQAVMTTTFNEVDMSGIADLRRRYREEFKARHGTDLGLMSFFIKATVAGLEAHPVLNAELQNDELVFKRYYDIGIAVAADEGLLVPVVRDADRKSFAEIERDVASLAGRARERKLTLDELRGGTFTLTNGGIFGSLMSTPVLNPPQVGILGMHRILERPVAVNAQVAIRPMMYLAVTYDHRVVEGSDAVRFLVRVKQLLEDPGRLLVHA